MQIPDELVLTPNAKLALQMQEHGWPLEVSEAVQEQTTALLAATILLLPM